MCFTLLHMDLCPRVIHVLPLALQMVYRSLNQGLLEPQAPAGRQQQRKQEGGVRLREGMVGHAGLRRVGRQSPPFPVHADPLEVLQEDPAQGLRAQMTEVCMYSRHG